MTFENAVEAMIGTPRFHKKPGFAVVKKSLSAIAYKEEIPVIHVAGTNGKGSVVTMLSQILQEAGYRVGTFTSPHLIDIRERIRINNEMMSKEAFGKLYDEIALTHNGLNIPEEHPTFFEMIFVMAMSYFNQQQPDVIILETGIGGRLDTTNVLEKKILSVITSISLDHIHLLGNDLKSIAKEKVGIIRNNTPLVFYNKIPDVAEVIKIACEDKGTPLVNVLPFEGKIHKRTEEGIDFSLKNKYYNYEELHIWSTVDYQIENVKIAISCIEPLRKHFTISDEAVVSGLEKFQWLGRMTYITPSLLLEGAHNYEGIQAFVSHLSTYEKDRSIELIFICMNDKQDKLMIKELTTLPNLKKVFIPQAGFEKGQDTGRLVGLFNEYEFSNTWVVNDLNTFIQSKLENMDPSTLLCCVGSLYLVGEVLKYMEEVNL